MFTPRLRLAQTGLALGVLLALIIAPQTRWLVRLQALTTLGQYHLSATGACPYTHSLEEDQRRRQAVAARLPDDYAIQYAAANGNTHAEVLANLRALTARFPNQPSLYANVLRYEALANLHFARPEPGWLLGTDPQRGYHPTPPTPQQLAAFDAEAAAGERVDPDNAYFPLMRAVGLFAAHRDAEALAAVRRAGGKTAWREYVAEDIGSRWRLHREAFGDDGAIPRTALLSGTWLPQYQGMMQAARIVVYKAMRDEQAGHPQEGLALRESVRRVGDLMRVQSTFLIGSIIGVNLCRTSCYRPGGVPLPHFTPGEWFAQSVPNADTVAAAYAAWARGQGREDIARATLSEAKAGDQVQRLVQTSDFSSGSVRNLTRLSRWWAADLALLANVFWVLLLGACAALAARVPPAWTARLSPNGWKALLRQLLTVFALVLWGLILLAFLVNAVNWMLVGGWDSVWRVGLAVAAVGAVAIWATRRALRRLPRSEGSGILLMLGMLLGLGVGLYGCYALLDWQTRGLREAWTVPAFFTPNAGGSDFQPVTAAVQWGSLAAALAAPALLALGLAVARRLRRPPPGGLRGFRDLALPVASLLLLAYGASALGTIRQENGQTARLQQEITNEGPSYAAQAGLPWPGPVP